MPFPAGAPNAGPALAPPSSNARNDLQAFASSGSNERWMLPNRVEPPASPYMLLPGRILPAVCDSAINSELPGSIIGHVSQAVYSSTGSHELLVPAGTKIFGEYSADVVFGQNRLLVAWQLLEFPNGATLDIGAMPGTDGLGRSGFEDQVDNHYLRLFGSALLLSLVTTGVTMAQNPGSSGGTDRMSVGGAMSQALGLQFGQVTAQLLQKNLNVAPTLDVRNGFRFNIVVTKKITFPGPYAGAR
jgi:type IV secretion system protein VirB10